MSGIDCTSNACASCRLLVDVHLDELVGCPRASRPSARSPATPAGTVRTTAPRSRRSPGRRCRARRLELAPSSPTSPTVRGAAPASAPTAARPRGPRRASRSLPRARRPRPSGPSGTRRTWSARRAPSASARARGRLLDRDQRVVGAVLHEHGDRRRRVPVELDAFDVGEVPAHREHAGRVRALGAPERRARRRARRPARSPRRPPRRASGRAPRTRRRAGRRARRAAASNDGRVGDAPGLHAPRSNHAKPGGAATGPRAAR